LLVDRAVAHDEHAVGHVGDDHVVRDQDGGGAGFPVDAFDRLEHEHAGRAVERAGRLVAQEQVRPLGDRARNRDALLLTARQLRREVVQALAEPYQPQRLLGRHRIGGELGDQRRVLERGEARDEVVELEYEADVLAPVARQAGVVEPRQLVVEEPGLAGRSGVEAAEDVEQRGLAAARRPEQHDQPAGIELQVEAAQGVHLDVAGPVDLAQAARAVSGFPRACSG
jgi:hypothetical protein